MKTSFLLIFFLPLFLSAQHINYSEPEADDTRKSDFEIIGRVGGNFLVFKNNPTENAVSIYGPEMKLIQRVELGFLPDRFANIDFVQYPDFFYMICEYQKKNVVHL